MHNSVTPKSDDVPDVGKQQDAVCDGSTEAASPPSSLGSRKSPESLRNRKISPTGEEGSHSVPQNSPTAENDAAAAKGVISLLQEFVQCSKHFPSPQHRPILQWNFDTRMADCTTLEFRAQVAFLLDGVPHHAAGAWQLSKKLAQRDTAERGLGFFVGGWASYLMGAESAESATAATPSLRKPAVPVLTDEEPVALLDGICKTLSACDGQEPSWAVSWDEKKCCATAEVSLLGVPHKFVGAHRNSEDEAKSDAAKRILWYLQVPGYSDCFEPNPRSEAFLAKEIPAPLTNWASNSADGGSLQAAQKKTTLMRVQNRLQQLLARRLKPGQSVWEWSYETDPEDSSWPPLCQASVVIASVGKCFEGPWVRGQREAQIETSLEVAQALNSGVLMQELADADIHGDEVNNGQPSPHKRESPASSSGKVKPGFLGNYRQRPAVGGW